MRDHLSCYAPGTVSYRLLLPLLAACACSTATPQTNSQPSQHAAATPLTTVESTQAADATLDPEAATGGAATGGVAIPQPDGEACLQATDCESGVCEGRGCTDEEPGVCMSAQRMCTRDYRPYCGCDGTTFHGSGTCPGQRYLHEGTCEEAEQPPA